MIPGRGMAQRPPGRGPRQLISRFRKLYRCCFPTRSAAASMNSALRRHVLSADDLALEEWRLAQAFSPAVPLGARGGRVWHRSGAQADRDVRRSGGGESHKHLDLRRPEVDGAVAEHAAE